MRSIRLAVHGGVLTFRALFQWLSPPVFLSAMMLTPLMQMLFFASFGPAFSGLDPTYFAVGNALQVSAMAGVHGVSQTIANERLFGAINNVFISPAGRVPLYLGRTWPHVVIGGLTSAAGLGIAALVFGLSLPADRWTALVLVVVVTVVSCCGMGMLFGALGLMGRDTSITANVAYLVLLVFTGASVPLERVPAAVAACSHALPMTNGIAALRRLVAVGPDGQFWVWIGWEAIVAVGWISLTVVLLRWIEQLARRTGSVDFS